MEKDKPQRRYDLDWMRVLLIISVFLYHSGRAFHEWDWHVKDVSSPGFASVLGFMEMWMLPAIFVVSAAGIWYSLGYQKAGRFIWSKVLRLLVPLVFGAFILAPYQVYLERYTHGQFSGPFFQWFPHYFEGLYGVEEGGNFAFHGMHLWYLMLLFLFSMLLMPLFLLFHSKAGKPIVRGLGSFLEIPGMIYLLGLVLALPMIYIDRDSILGTTKFAGWNMVYYFILMFFGYLIFADERIQQTIIKQRFFSLMLAIALIVLLESGIFIKTQAAAVGPLFQYTLSSWCFILAILGLGMKYLSATSRFLRYATEAVLPFYMLHQPIILLIAFWVVQLQIPILVKFLIIVVLSLAGIMLLYEGVRQVGVLRFFFGMKLRCRAVVKVRE
ncbi:MAG: acyltransferase family protein [Spirochaetaceae bacterium]|nr:MAG: acyltransferase family protein [Spirochaetaceae bacterium]